jgi:hypothetical protein
VDIAEGVTRLIDAWCDRRCLYALREILRGWPVEGGLTDQWAELLDALKGVRAFASHELTESEADEVHRLIEATERLVFR